MTRADFVRGFTMLCEVYGEPVSDLRAELYLEAVSSLSASRWLDVVRVAIRSHKFFPRPSELLEIARDLRPAPPKVPALEDQHRAPHDAPGRVAFGALVERLRRRHGVSTA